MDTGLTGAPGAPDVVQVLSLLRGLSTIYDRVEQLTRALRAAAEAEPEDGDRLDSLLEQRDHALTAADAALDVVRAAAADPERWRRCVADAAVRGGLAALTARLDAIRTEDAAIAELLLRQRGVLLKQVTELRDGRAQLQAYAGMGRAAPAAHVDRRR